MVIVINALSARRGGGQTYLLNLLRHMDACREAYVYVLAPATLKLPEHPRITRQQMRWPTENPLLRTLGERMLLPGLLKRLNADILFCPGGLVNTVPPRGCRTVTMFRNMMPFDHVQRKKYPYGLMRMRNWILERALLKSMVKADLVIFISDFAKSVIESRAGGLLRDTITIPHGINEHFKVTGPLPRPTWLPREDYFLYVSILDVYKGQLEIVRGYHLLKQRRQTREKLILAGLDTTAYAHKVRGAIEKLGLQEDVILTGNIPYADLPAVYHHAKVNIFASQCENCPNILLEALGAGRPLLVSNHPPMPEFGGDAVDYFDPTSPEEVASKLLAVIDDAGRLAILSKRARNRADMYDWKNTAHKTWSALIGLGARQV